MTAITKRSIKEGIYSMYMNQLFIPGSHGGYGYKYQMLNGDFADWSGKYRWVEFKKLRTKNKPVSGRHW